MKDVEEEVADKEEKIKDQNEEIIEQRKNDNSYIPSGRIYLCLRTYHVQWGGNLHIFTDNICVLFKGNITI